jgi:signal transduction histidine kinase
MNEVISEPTRPSDELEPLFAELWRARGSDESDGARQLVIDSLAVRLVAVGQPASLAVQRVLEGGRALVEHAEGPAEARRLQRAVDETAVQLAVAVETARHARRQSWLSFLVHELKNPLNTVLNALWLLRQKAGGDPAQIARFLELAERGVKRLETRTRDVRELDEQLVNAPPGWEEAQRARSQIP